MGRQSVVRNCAFCKSLVEGVSDGWAVPAHSKRAAHTSKAFTCRLALTRGSQKGPDSRSWSSAALRAVPVLHPRASGEIVCHTSRISPSKHSSVLVSSLPEQAQFAAMPDGSQKPEKLDMSAPSGDKLRVISDEKGGAIPAKGGGPSSHARPESD